jgi:hypothetical protein
VKERFAKEGYTLLSKEYINNAQKLDVMCPEGHITQTDLSHFTGGKRCHFCKGGVVYTYEFVKNTIESEPGYKLISYAYTNVFTPIKIQCSEGHIYETHFTYWQQGFRCTVCSESSGEIRVKGYLDNNKYKYIYQYKFDDCKNKQVLPFDFGILDENGKLLFLIEYDGEYHYKPIDGQEMLEYQQMLDNIKNTYCLKNNIRLLRIPYWEINNIPKILDKEFNNKEFKIGA